MGLCPPGKTDRKQEYVRAQLDVKKGMTAWLRSSPIDALIAKESLLEKRGLPSFSGHFLNPSLKASPMRRAASVMVSIMSFAPSA